MPDEWRDRAIASGSGYRGSRARLKERGSRFLITPGKFPYGHMQSSSRTFSTIPMATSSDWTIGTALTSGGVVGGMKIRLLQICASHTPSPSVSYDDLA